jgi:hypothetical protein
VNGIRGYDLADHHPIEEHSQRGQTKLHRRFGVQLELCLDEYGDVDRLHLGEIPDAMLGTEGGKLPDGLPVRTAGVGLRTCELKKSRIRVRVSGCRALSCVKKIITKEMN